MSLFITHAGGRQTVGRVISGVCDCVCVCVFARAHVCVCVSTINTKLGTHICSMTVAQHAFIKGQTVKGQGHTVPKTATIAWLLVAAVAVRLLIPAWDCVTCD